VFTIAKKRQMCFQTNPSFTGNKGITRKKMIHKKYEKNNGQEYNKT